MKRGAEGARSREAGRAETEREEIERDRERETDKNNRKQNKDRALGGREALRRAKRVSTGNRHRNRE